MVSRRFLPSILAVLFLFGSLPGMVHAANQDEDEPIRIDARAVEANDKTGVVVYTGNVVVEQGALSIRADRVEIKTHNSKTELVRATGKPAKLRQRPEGDGGDIHAEAGRVDYHVALRKVDLVGHVTLRRGEDLFTADTLHYDLDSESLNAAGNDQGNGRVHAVIQPKNRVAQPRPIPETP